MAKLTRDLARSEAKRLGANPMLLPQTDEGLKEIINCLMRHCQTAEQCTAAMTAFLDRTIEIPRDIDTTTGQLAFCANALRNPEEPPAGCKRCDLGPDAYSGEQRWSSHVPGERNGYTVAVRCDCERGRWMTAKDAERQPMAEVRKPVKLEKPAEDWARRAAGELE